VPRGFLVCWRWTGQLSRGWVRRSPRLSQLGFASAAGSYQLGGLRPRRLEVSPPSSSVLGWQVSSSQVVELAPGYDAFASRRRAWWAQRRADRESLSDSEAGSLPSLVDSSDDELVGQPAAARVLGAPPAAERLSPADGQRDSCDEAEEDDEGGADALIPSFEALSLAAVPSVHALAAGAED